MMLSWWPHRRLFGLLIYIVFCANPALLFAQTPEQLKDDLDRGGEVRRRAIWYIYQNERHELLPAAAALLFQSHDLADHKAVLNVLHAYGERLEQYLPNWHVILDKYMTPEADDEIVLDCVALTRRWKETRLVPALSRLARHPQSRVRLAAFGALAELSNDMLIPVLIRLVQAERPVFRIYGLEGLAWFGDPRLWSFLLDSLGDPSKSVRIYAVRALAEQPKGEEKSHYLVRRYGDEADPEVRARILEVVADRGWRRHSALVRRGVTDAVPLVRKAALDAVLTLKERGATRQISTQLGQEDRRELKLYGIKVLMELENSGGGNGLRSLLESDPDPAVRQRAALALGYLKERSGVASLTQAVVDDRSEEVRMESAEALGILGDNRAIRALVETIRRNGESYEVRSAATLALARIGSRDSLEALEDLGRSYEGQALGRHIQQLLRRLRN
jgi:HEAT repeat protein